VKVVKLGGLETVVVGPDGGPTVVLMHGFGAPGDDLVPLARVVPAAKVRWVFPAAPLSLPSPFGDSRAWWLIDLAKLERAVRGGGQASQVLADSLAAEVPKGLAEARGKLLGLLDDLGPTEPLILGGFSQGAMLACDVALHSAMPLAGLAMMSGALVAEREWAQRFSHRSGLRALMSHGRQDPLLPIESAERLRTLCRDSGWDVEWMPFDGGHEIPRPVLSALAGMIERST
jgi:phospholipase/carboxylesterase